nr:hypothetical protein [Tanacetum cinerariifolium]
MYKYPPLRSGRSLKELASAFSQLFFGSCKSLGGTDQSHSGVFGLSSSGTGFIKSGLVFNLGRCAISVSSESETFTLSVIGTFSIGCSKCEAHCCLEADPEAPSAVTRTTNSESDVLCYGGGGGSGRIVVVGIVVAVKISA